MSEQFLSTSRLSNVMRLIVLGRQTGVLRVVRGQGPSREEGEVQFIGGRIAMAAVGQLSGSAAMSVLQNWGESAYVFLDGVNRLQQYSIDDNLAWGGMPPPSGPLPPAGSGSFPAAPFNSPPYRNTGQLNGNGSSPTGPWQSYQSGSLPQIGPAQRISEPHYVPRRLTNIHPAEATQLDRRERQLLLLVDNRRMITDFVRLTRRGDEEIRYILAHLIALGLVE